MGPAVPQRIPWRDVVLWCEYHGLGSVAVDLYDGCFAALDEVFIGWKVEQMRRAMPRKGG